MSRTFLRTLTLAALLTGCPLAGLADGGSDDICGRNHYILGGGGLANLKCDVQIEARGILVSESATTYDIGHPNAVVADALGNVYMSAQSVVYRVDRAGRLWRIAGTGEPGFSGDGGPAAMAMLDIPEHYTERDASPTEFDPLFGGLALDAGGRLYIADAYNNRVRVVDAYGTISTVLQGRDCGQPCDGYSVGSASVADLSWPQGIAIDAAGSLYVASAWGRLWRMTEGAVPARVADNNCGTPGGPGLCAPAQIAVDASGNLFASQFCSVRKLAPDGALLPIGYQGDYHAPDEDPAAEHAAADDDPAGQFLRPFFFIGHLDACGNHDEGAPGNSPIGYSWASTVDREGNVFVSDLLGCVHRMGRDGRLFTVAGQCESARSTGSYAGEGQPIEAPRTSLTGLDLRLADPRGLFVDADGTLYIADAGHGRVVKVLADGTASTIAGNVNR